MNNSQLNNMQHFTHQQFVTRPNLPLRRIIRLKQLIQYRLSGSASYDRLDDKAKRYGACFTKPIKLGTSTNAAVG